MKITMYELLGMVKDGKAPKKIKYDGKLYEFNDTKDNYYENETCSINWDYVSLHCLNEKVEILEEKKTIDDLNLSLQEIETFQEARQIFLKLNNEEDKQTFIKLLLGEGTYERWIDYLKSKGE